MLSRAKLNLRPRRKRRFNDFSGSQAVLKVTKPLPDLRRRRLRRQFQKFTLKNFPASRGDIIFGTWRQHRRAWFYSRLWAVVGFARKCLAHVGEIYTRIKSLADDHIAPIAGNSAPHHSSCCLGGFGPCIMGSAGTVESSQRWGETHSTSLSPLGRDCSRLR